MAFQGHAKAVIVVREQPYGSLEEKCPRQRR